MSPSNSAAKHRTGLVLFTQARTGHGTLTLKIAYLAYWDASQESGVLKKISSQMEEWKNQGHESKLFLISPDAKVWEGISHLPLDMVISKRVRTNLIKTKDAVRLIKAWQPDLVYIRFSLFYPALADLCRSFPSVLEINSYDISEFKLSLPKYVYIYHIMTRHWLLSQASGFIFVTEEIANKFTGYRQPKRIISNGINLKKYPRLPAPDNPYPHLVFMGSPLQSWHGIDQIFWLAQQFPEWRFDIVGTGKEDISLDIPENIHLHGFLSRNRYEKIVLSADAAFGTLALYRTGLHQACPLKLREYLAYGLPVIIGYEDVDFPDPVPFLLQLPSSEDNVKSNFLKIKEFVNSWKGRRVKYEDIAHIDFCNKEAQRLSFFSEIIHH